MKKYIMFIVAICLLSVAVLSGCGAGDSSSKPSATPAATPEASQSAQAEFKEGEKVMIEITMADGGVMELELYPDIAPITVSNFVKLVKSGFYDGLTFHRIIKGFMIQGGDPEGTGMGGSEETIKGEFKSNGVENTLKHERGVISMARSQNKNSASSQFFIMHADATHLDGEYAAFGKMTSGFEVLDKLAQTPVTDANGTVAKEGQPVIKSIVVK